MNGYTDFKLFMNV